MGFVRVLQEKDLAPNAMKGVQAEGKKILVANVGRNYYAIGDVCTHLGCLLSGGRLAGDNVVCPCHASSFSVKTGSVIKGPAKNPAPTYQVKVEGDQVLVNV